jgi:hypothetical protein
MKWVGHKYFTLVATNCWCLAKSAHEIGWDYHDPSPVCNKEYCQVLYEASVEPDDKKLWSKCSKELKLKSYMTGRCPPPPPYHHERDILKAVDYYLLLSRVELTQAVDRQDDELYKQAWRHFGWATHYMADFIINPYVLRSDLTAKWDYDLRADPITDECTKVDPLSVVADDPNRIFFPTPHDYTRYGLWKARGESVREEYRLSVQRAVRVAKTLFVALTRGWYHGEEVLLTAMSANLLPYAYGMASGNIPLALLGAVGSSPSLSYLAKGRAWVGTVLQNPW